MTIEIDEELKNKSIKNLTKNLTVLRTMMNLSQAELATLIGVGRQTLVAIENNKRKMTWSVFLSLLFVFRENKDTCMLLDIFDIYSNELKTIYKRECK